jgi:hypothetical protein
MHPDLRVGAITHWSAGGQRGGARAGSHVEAGGPSAWRRRVTDRCGGARPARDGPRHASRWAGIIDPSVTAVRGMGWE